MASDHSHTQGANVAIPSIADPAAGVTAPPPVKPEPVQSWQTYAPALLSLSMLLVGVILDQFANAWFRDPIRLIWYLLAYLPAGWPVVKRAVKNILKGNVFTEFFLMSTATIGAFLIREYPEGVAVMVFYTIGELFQEAAVLRARRSIKALLDVRPDHVTVLREGKSETIAAVSVQVGDYIQVKAGEKVGLDSIMLSEQGSFDTAALTGESVPRTIRKGEAVLAGMINRHTLVDMEVTTPFADSKLSRILKLVMQATSRKARTQEFIARFAKIYTPIIFGLAVLITVLPYFFIQNYVFSNWLYRGLVFLVIGCPCALVISIPLGYFGGIGAASRHGILVKGSVFLDLLTQLKTVVMDKTGTLTKGTFNVRKVEAIGFDQPTLIRYAAALESKSTHPVAQAIREYAAASGTPSNHETIALTEVKEISGHGMSGWINGQQVLAGNARLLRMHGITFDEALATLPETLVLMAIDGRYAGYFLIADQLKSDAVTVISRLKQQGIRTVMLSGDRSPVVEAVARQVGVEEWHGDLLPEDKVAHVERLQAQSAKAKLAFVGDGVNDAPVVALADVGMAMGGLGSDATIETADVVIQNDNPTKIATAIRIGQATRRIVWQNISLSLGVKAIVLLLGAGGVATLWEAVFADVGVALLAILNAVRVQHVRFD